MEEKRFKALQILEDLENITAVALLVVGHYIDNSVLLPEDLAAEQFDFSGS